MEKRTFIQPRGYVADRNNFFGIYGVFEMITPARRITFDNQRVNNFLVMSRLYPNARIRAWQ
jgi:hypothetical protein